MEAENIDYVICPLCLHQNKGEIESRKRFISPLHLSSHDLTTKEFKEKFPNQQIKCLSLCQQHSNRMKGENHFNYGKHLSEDIRKNISQGVIDNFVYDNCTECGRQIVLENIDDNKICKFCSKETKASEDTKELLFCRICGKQKKNLFGHITRQHKISIEEYKEKYKVSFMYAEASRDKFSNCHFDHMSQDHKNKITFLASKRKVERNLIDKVFKIENYLDLIEKAKLQQLVDTNEYVYCRVCFEKFNKISAAHLWIHKLSSSVYSKIFPGIPLVCSNTAKQIAKKSFATKIKNGQMKIGNCYGHGGFRKDIGHYVRSMTEANFARILKLNNIRYKYEVKTFELENSKFTSYTPDFFLLDSFEKWDKETFIEIKGYSDADTELKHDDFRKQYPEVKWEMIKTKNSYLDYLENKYKDQIPLWEDRKQNIRKMPGLYS